MKDSPFVFGTTVCTRSFTDRKAEKKKLINNLTGGINTMIISPRRWGKSSLVEKVILEINKKRDDKRTVLIDLFSVSSKEEFLETFARNVIKSSSTKIQEWVSAGKYFFKSLAPKISIGTSPETDFSISFDWKELQKHGDEVLNLPEIIAQKKNIKFIICLDEFQNLATIGGFAEFEKKMRAVWQRQKNVTYCLYGSKRHMMADIFNNPAKPFYRFGDVMLLQKIEQDEWVKFICKSFSETNKIISENDACTIATLMKNTSWYVQQLAHYTWLLSDHTTGSKEINAAMNELIRANTPFYQQQTEILSTTQLNLLKAVAKGETKFTSTSVMQGYYLGTPNNVIKNKNNLINNDVIQEVNGVFEFVDPAFEFWFNTQYFN